MKGIDFKRLASKVDDNAELVIGLGDSDSDGKSILKNSDINFVELLIMDHVSLGELKCQDIIGFRTQNSKGEIKKQYRDRRVMDVVTIVVLAFFLTAEFWARLIAYLVQLFKPNWFKPEFNAWKHPIPAGWMHKLFR